MASIGTANMGKIVDSVHLPRFFIGLIQPLTSLSTCPSGLSRSLKSSFYHFYFQNSRPIIQQIKGNTRIRKAVELEAVVLKLQ